MVTGQQVQGIGDTQPFLDADVGRTKQMFDNPDGILVREAITGAQDPFELKNYSVARTPEGIRSKVDG